jgi:ABC-type nitrate/sulfonate/bicarbonate transport system permease component
MAASRRGLGYELMKSEGAFYMDKIISIVLVLSLIAAAVNVIFYWVEGKLGQPRLSKLA